MRVTVRNAEMEGTVAVPASKSLSIRALMCAALSKGESTIKDLLISEDTEAAIRVLRQLGIQIRNEGNVWHVSGGTFQASAEELHCGESATTLRFLTALCALIPGTHTIVGGPSVSKRPVKSLVEALRKLGVNGEISGKTSPPVTIEGGTLKGGVTELPGNISSQFISALLLVAPYAQKEISIRLTTPMTSKPYVLMTLWMQKQFGVKVNSHVDRFVVPRQNYKPANVRVEGDWSSASYFLTLGAGAKAITVENLATGSLQGDRIILDYLRSMGAKAQVRGKSITVSGGQELRAIHADMTDCIDLLPTMGILAALANGTTDLTGIERARIKESNRVAAVRQGLERLGIPVTETEDRLKITGLNTPSKVEAAYGEDEDENKKEEVKETPPPVVIDSFDDHRIAMAFGVLGSIIGCTTVNEHDFGDIVIDGAECVAKTFPDFWESLKAVGGAVENNE